MTKRNHEEIGEAAKRSRRESHLAGFKGAADSQSKVDPIQAMAGRNVEAQLLLPNTKVGVVIGKGGAVINHIRETSKATLDIAEPQNSQGSQGPGGPGPAERVVTFSGDFTAVYTAFQMVLQHLSSAAAAANQMDPMTGPPVMESVILVPRNKTGGLIGRSGSSINQVRSDSGATVKVGAPEDIVPSEPDVRKCIISGTIDQVMQAFALIVHKLTETPARAARSPDPTPTSQPHQPLAPDTKSILYEIPNASMGAVIGRAGATIKHIREASGARIEILEFKGRGSTHRDVIIYGTEEQIHAAQHLIQDLLPTTL